MSSVPPGAEEAEALLELLVGRGLTLGCAESCTGGMVSAAITAVPGASRAFKGAIVSYSNDAKVTALGVPRATLETRGAVSVETARAMAEGARRALGVDCAVAITGIAGPDGGTPDKPVGTVCFGLSAGGRHVETRECFQGDRNDVRERATRHALSALRSFVEQSS